jgi:radical SAM protein with 4Fe4S-binding SPASM domain
MLVEDLPPPDPYGFARAPEAIQPIPYGRFRNVYLYITDKCQLRCGHCYMGERLDAATVMPKEEVFRNLDLWRRMGGSKLSILGGEPTLHPDFLEIVRHANLLGFEKVILNTNGLPYARRKLRSLVPADFSYIQVSLDGASPATHDRVRGAGTFGAAWSTTQELSSRGFDTRVICTVNRVNIKDCLDLLPMADDAGVSLVKFHVFSGIGLGKANDEWLVSPTEWIDFYEKLELERGRYKTRIWYQPTYARKEKLQDFADQGFRGCIGRTLDRISIFPDGRAYVCSYLFDTNLNYAQMRDGRIEINKGDNEFDLFTGVLTHPTCGTCKARSVCMGGCPAEKLVMGGPSCAADPEIIPVCRLWKAEIQ